MGLVGKTGLAARVCPALSSEARRLTRLAQIAGQSERLASALERHADQCAYVNIKSGLEALARAEIADAQRLRDLLLPRGVWPVRSRTPPREGANNWARLSADLAVQVEMVRALNAAIATWEGVDRQVAARLREIARAKENRLGEMRGLTLKCDPQALD
jgi:hypothetical protein